MKKILLLLVGGTICTTVNEKGTLSVYAGAGSALKASFEASDSDCVGKAEIVQSRNLGILSENMTADKWNVIIDTLKEYTASDTYDGIIFAHGTDTLAFSASLFSMLLSKADIPVFFVSANLPLSHAGSNGADNFRCAVECICRNIPPRVYVPYRNPSDKKLYLHIGSRLRQCQNYSDDFYSMDAVDVTDMNAENYAAYFARLDERFPLTHRKSGITPDTVGRLSDCVLKIVPYVGLRYDAFVYDRFKAVLHGTFHAGTACAEDAAQYGRNAVLYLLDACATAGVDVYMSPSKAEGEVYDTVRVIAEHKAGGDLHFLYGCTEETVYVKLLLGYATFTEKDEILRYLHTEYHFEKGCDIP